MSIRAKIGNGLLRIASKPYIHNPDNIAPVHIRAKTNRGGDKPWPKTVTVDVVQFDQFEVYWITPKTLQSKAICYYLHGGGYIFGAPHTTHRRLLCFLAVQSGMRVFAINYRKAPEQPFPCAIEDAWFGFQHLLAQGIAPDMIAIAGDSAGGGLAMALLLRLNGEAAALPACTGLLSPWIDLTASGESAKTNLKSDYIIPGDLLPHMAGYYAGGQSLDTPALSPLYGDLSGLPPTYIQASSSEVLRDDSTRLEIKLRAAAVPVALDIWKNLPHVWQISPGLLPEAKQSLQRLALFMRTHVKHGHASLPDLN